MSAQRLELEQSGEMTDRGHETETEKEKHCSDRDRCLCCWCVREVCVCIVSAGSDSAVCSVAV